jgi:hypothetical protein
VAVDKDLQERVARSMRERQARRKPKFVATEEGIALAKHRISTEPEFRAGVKDCADADPEYAAFLKSVGIEV